MSRTVYHWYVHCTKYTMRIILHLPCLQTMKIKKKTRMKNREKKTFLRPTNSLLLAKSFNISVLHNYHHLTGGKKTRTTEQLFKINLDIYIYVYQI